MNSRKIKKTRLTIRKIGKCFYDASYWTVMHDGIEHAGYMAFLGLLSFFPFLVFLVAVAGVLGQTQMGDNFVNNIVINYLPENILLALEPRINEILSGPPQGLLTIAIIGIIWTASSAVEGTRTILNRAYRVQTPPAYIWRRLLSIAQFLALIIVIIIGMTVMIFLPVIWYQIKEYLPINPKEFEYRIHYIQYVISPAILFLVVSISYYILPNIKQRWTYVCPGTFLTLSGWVGFAYLFTSYLKNFEQVNLVYGSLGGIIASLLFFYIVSIIYIFGAEFNYFFEKALGRKLPPKVKVKKNKHS